jgi:hypothetical protein
MRDHLNPARIRILLKPEDSDRMRPRCASIERRPPRGGGWVVVLIEAVRLPDIAFLGHHVLQWPNFVQ